MSGKDGQKITQLQTDPPQKKGKHARKNRRKKENGNKRGTNKKKQEQVQIALYKPPATKPYQNRSYIQGKDGYPSNLSDFATNLTKQERAAAIAWLLNMLDPQKEFRFPRPIPALSDTDLKSGEIFFESKSDYTEVRVRPDPFELISIRQLGITATVNIAGIDNFGENFAFYNSGESQAQMVAGDHYYNTQLNLPLNNGTFVAPIKVFKFGVQSGGFVNNQMDADAIFMYPPITPPSQNIIGRWTNDSSTSLDVALGWVIRSGDGSVISSNYGTVVTIAGNTSAQVSSAGFATLPAVASTQFLSLTWRVGVPNGQRVAISSQAFEFTNMTGLNVTTPIATEYWTLGEACYGKTSSDAQILDGIIRDCQLWAPCGMSSKYNVDQQFNTAGGRFQTAFLPSRIDQKLPSDFNNLWTFVDSRKTSYPVAETPFVKGAQGSWVGMRIQDYEFRRPFESGRFQNFEVESTPQIHFLSKKVADAASVTLRLDFNLAYELQTTHPAYTMSVGLFHPGFAGLVGAFLSAHQLLVGENPSHVQRLTKLAKQALTNPMVQQAFKQLFTMGLALL